MRTERRVKDLSWTHDVTIEGTAPAWAAQVDDYRGVAGALEEEE